MPIELRTGMTLHPGTITTVIAPGNLMTSAPITTDHTVRTHVDL